ncbi:glycosyltransferase family 4 protein [Cyanobacterium aponinum UTEX 3222]|uniref:glycosyltransferase family 4 protein n=1 Tax=Cyanobacterium aponinum TaxID=379064 RepID=UPI00308F14B7|nr:glycosyltransferase family 4 protein [Cyanobacterium aponinum UTEX 3222]
MNNLRDKKLKILHLITRLVVGGAQDNTLLTVKNHDRTFYHACLASNPDGVWLDRAKDYSDHFYPLSSLVNPISPLKDWKAFWDIVSILKKEKIDLVHTHSSKAGILGRLAANYCKIPVVHTIHGFPFHDFMPSWQRQFYITLEKAIAQKTDFFITVCELNRKEALELEIAREDNSQTIYSGIDFDKLDETFDSQSLRQELNIASETKIITMVGRLDQQKAPYYLITAFAKVVEKCSDTVLLLVGEGELKESLKNQVEKLDIEEKVKFLGSRNDVPAILNITDIFALSSLWEGLGRAMTEAMLIGKPVVVPNIYGIPETVHHNETGLLFEAKDTDKLAENLIFLLENPQECDRVGKNAKELTRKLFDGKEMVKRIEAIYQKVLETKGISQIKQSFK